MSAPRPRAARGKTGKPYMYMPTEYKKHQAGIQEMLRSERVKCHDGIFFVELEHYFQVPQGLTAQQRDIVSTAPFRETTPDVDNLDKTIMDALNGIVWPDDALVVGTVSIKLYGQEEGTQINVYRADRQQSWHTGFKANP